MPFPLSYNDWAVDSSKTQEDKKKAEKQAFELGKLFWICIYSIADKVIFLIC